MRLLAAICLTLGACGPVVLDDGLPTAPPTPVSFDAAAADVGDTGSAADDASVGAPSPVQAHVSVGPLTCEGCYDLVVDGAGGTPPYRAEWSDGTFFLQRTICVSESTQLSVALQDARGVRSVPVGVALQKGKAACNEAAPMLCLANLSFEATSADGSPLEVEAWSDCTSDDYLNTPDIGSVLASPSNVARPEATDGTYYVGLSEEEQVSQRMCTAAQAGERRSFEIDLMSVPRSLLAVGSEQQSVFLEVWGGIAADCSQRQLLWASPPLPRSWKRYCVTTVAEGFMDQLTLRARSDMTSGELGYVAIDNLTPVERCTAP